MTRPTATSTTGASALPKNWPLSVTYITAPYIPRPLDPLILRVDSPDTSTVVHMSKNSGSPASFSSSSSSVTPSPTFCSIPGPSPLVRIQTIARPTHPAHGQSGLFATRALPPDSFILFYLGLVHTAAGADAGSDYDLSVDRERDVAMDATRWGNEARFINDYRGISDSGPNAEFRDCVVQVASGGWEKRFGVFVLGKGKAGAKAKRARGIAKGEEIVVSYGKGFWTARSGGDEGGNGREWEGEADGEKDGV